MSSATSGSVGTATRTIEEAYRECVEARVAYIDQAPAVTDSVRHQLHQHLHSATLSYFEVLHYELATKNAVQKFWDEAKMWRDGYKRAPAYFCQTDGCQFRIWKKDADAAEYEVHNGAVCPSEECNGKLVAKSAIVPNENGRPQQAWVRGLKQLEDWFYSTESRKERRQGYLGTRTVEVRQHSLLPVKVLFRAGRHLDAAADKLNLLADVEDSMGIMEMPEDAAL